MSSDELSLAEDSQDEVLSIAEEVDENAEGEVDDLFGDEGSDQEDAAPKRTLDDEQLDSGDDENRHDRVKSQSVEIEEQETQFSAVHLPRHLIPQPGDNELYLLKVPPFLALEPHVYDSQDFEPPKHDHHSQEASKAFSAYDTAMTTIRWRHSPSDPSELQSTARVIRWSDGSLTMQLATDPTVQYDLSGRPLAPPQTNPPKPTPTTAAAKRSRNQVYDIKDESWTYLYSPLPSAYALRAVGKITTSLQVQIPAKDDSVESLKASMAAIAAKYADKGLGQKTVKIEVQTGDPLRYEKDAQKIEREILRKARKEDRDRERNIKFGRAGGGRAGGLTIDALESEGFGRPKAQRTKGGPRRPRRDEYSDEEDELYGVRGGPQDVYDMEDKFIAASDEDGEEEEGGSEDAEGEEEIDDIIERQERGQKQSPKRAREDEDGGNAQGSPVSRAKRRRVVESDED